MTYEQRWEALKTMLRSASNGYASECPDEELAEAWKTMGEAMQFILAVMGEMEADPTPNPSSTVHPSPLYGVQGILAKNARYVTETFDDKIVIEVSNATDPQAYDAVSAWLRGYPNA